MVPLSSYLPPLDDPREGEPRLVYAPHLYPFFSHEGSYDRLGAARRHDIRVMYQWSDGAGNVHFVSRLDQVPAEYRANVGRIEMGEPKPRRKPARDRVGYVAQKTAEARKKRPFAYQPDPTVVVYTTPWCGWCRKTQAWLDGKGIAYENRDIEADSRWRDELIRKTGRTSIPVVEIEGELVRGFNPDKMQQLIARAS